MADRTFLDWPFLDDAHRELHDRLSRWCERERSLLATHGDLDNDCRKLVAAYGDAGWLRYAIPEDGEPDVRSLCVIRETLAYHSGLADFTFALQGLGMAPVTLHANDGLKQRYSSLVRSGKAIAAFAISEAEAGSDLAAMQTAARRDGDGYVINGEKTWISNAGIAAHYVVFCRFPEAGERKFVALLAEAGNPGLKVSKRIDVIAPHPLGTLEFTDCRVPSSALIGREGDGLKIALSTLDVFRPTVGAASLGMARRALDEAVTFAKGRIAFGRPLAEAQLIQAKIAEMATLIDTSALLIYRAAWLRDKTKSRISREAAMAKQHATDSAQHVIDEAVQILGGRGVVSGAVVERLYREVRALRIYEGTSEIQKLIIAGQVLNG